MFDQIVRIRTELVTFRGHLAQVVDSEVIRGHRVVQHIETLTYGAHHFLWTHGHWVVLAAWLH